jgi:ABC-2 type transport system permease protein
MTRLLRLLRGYVVREWLQMLTWRGFLVTLVINQAVTPLLGLAVWSAALPGDSAVMTYYVALLAVQLMTVSYEHHTFSDGIYAGDISGELLKPQPVVLMTLGTNLAMRVWHLLIGLPFILAAYVMTGASFDVGNILVATPALILAATLRFLFTYSLALVAFWTQRAHGVVGFGETLIFLLGGVAAPITLFPPGVRLLGEALPFRAMVGFPAEVASGSLDGAQVVTGYGWQVIWIAVFVLVATFAWRSGVRRYTAVGG